MFPKLEDMIPISVPQLLAEFDAILDRVEAGECVRIVEDGKPTLILIPYRALAHPG
jgi:antitoxin (DNA-binding transcriptional repressor) of toxin-antitoxin stability system